MLSWTILKTRDWTFSYYIYRYIYYNFLYNNRVRFSGSNVQYELVFLPGQIFRLEGRSSNATHELVFIASEVSPLGLVNYHVERINDLEPPPRPTPHNSTEDVTIENGVYNIIYSKLNLKSNKSSNWYCNTQNMRIMKSPLYELSNLGESNYQVLKM